MIFTVGQPVIRYMGVAGGWWMGHVIKLLDGDHVLLGFNWKGSFGADGEPERYDLAFGQDVSDPNLFAAPRNEAEAAALEQRIRAERLASEPLNDQLSVPMWPQGYFGDEDPPIRCGVSNG